MPKDYKRHLKLNSDWDWVDAVEKSDYKAKPREIDNTWILPYWKERDDILMKEADEETKQAIAIRYGMLGVKSAPKMKVYTEAEDQAKRASRHAEDNIVSKWGKNFKVDHPGVPFTIDKVAQQRSNLGGVIHKASQYQKGNPDICIQAARAGYHACFIEQKKSEDIFYKGTRILKPGSNNQHIWQSLYHADLRAQGYWVMFSISLEATKKMADRYMAGNPYPMQAFDYYCKPEDYAMFEFHPHFKPIEKV